MAIDGCSLAAPWRLGENLLFLDGHQVAQSLKVRFSVITVKFLPVGSRDIPWLVLNVNAYVLSFD